MRPLVENQSVQYVNVAGKIVDATIIEPVSPTTARLNVGDNATAFAVYSEDHKARNTFHFADGDEEKAKPFTPGTGSPAKAESKK